MGALRVTGNGGDSAPKAHVRDLEGAALLSRYGVAFSLGYAISFGLLELFI